MGLARDFDGTDDEIICSIGSTNLTGALTMAALVRNDSTASTFYAMGNYNSGGAGAVWLWINASGKVQLTTPVSTTSVNEDEWVIIAASKGSGTVTPRAHIYQSGSWTHENMSATLADPSSQAGGTVEFGAYASVLFQPAQIAVAAEWQANLTDSEIEAAVAWDRAGNWGAGAAPDPDGLWSFQQDDVTTSVTDLTGGGADQTSRTGTSVITDGPESFYYKTQPVGGTISSTAGLTRTVLLRSDG